MKLITRDIDYALRAICYIGKEKGRVVSVSELVGKFKIPRPFLRKLLQKLNKSGILKSYKGKNGGFVFCENARNLSLVELMGIFQGRIELSECLFKKKVCQNKKTCCLRKVITRIEDNVISELGRVKIYDLLKGG